MLCAAAFGKREVLCRTPEELCITSFMLRDLAYDNVLHQTQNSKPQNERIGLVITQTFIIPHPHNQGKSTAGLQRFATQKCEACADEEQQGQIRP